MRENIYNLTFLQLYWLITEWVVYYSICLVWEVFFNYFKGYSRKNITKKSSVLSLFSSSWVGGGGHVRFMTVLLFTYCALPLYFLCRFVYFLFLYKTVYRFLKPRSLLNEIKTIFESGQIWRPVQTVVIHTLLFLNESNGSVYYPCAL